MTDAVMVETVVAWLTIIGLACLAGMIAMAGEVVHRGIELWRLWRQR